MEVVENVSETTIVSVEERAYVSSGFINRNGRISKLREKPLSKCSYCEWPVRTSRAHRVVKRSLDLLGAVILLALFSPIMLVVAIAVKLTSKGPILYTQSRLTERGEVFKMHKFRTMRVDAEKIYGPRFASVRDPRVTPIGGMLRKYRLDELPQLFDVLRGKMSLVGPRPERPELHGELELSIPKFRSRLEVKAGLTGLAQIKNGYASDDEGLRKKVALDLVYINHQSLLMDLGILLKTVPVMLTGSGAR
ncbi:MAG: sugar transferase [Bdellovibrionales bacterium]|nr:sugar transferase [Bdellovibrionales bacterium]